MRVPLCTDTEPTTRVDWFVDRAHPSDRPTALALGSRFTVAGLPQLKAVSGQGLVRVLATRHSWEREIGVDYGPGDTCPEG